MFPESILQIIDEVTKQNGDDVLSAVDEAMVRIQADPSFQSIVDKMVRLAISELIYKARHKSNVSLKKQIGAYQIKPKVKITESTQVLESYNSLYNFYIGGKTLGNILGADLDKIANQEEAKAKGVMFNANLCRKLSSIVPKDKLVREVLSERKLQNIFNEVKDNLEY